MLFSQPFKCFLFLICLLLVSCSKKSPEEHLIAAEAYISQNNPAAAVVELKNALQLDPQSAKLRFMLGKLYVQNRQFENAEKELNRALEYGYSTSDVLPLLSESYQKTGAYVALSDMDHADITMSEDDQVKVGYFKVLSLVRLEKIPEARLLVSDLLEKNNKSVFHHLIHAYQNILEEQFEQALVKVESLQDNYATNEYVLKLRAQLLLQLQRRSEAADVYTQYLELQPGDQQIQFVLANLLVELKQFERAEPLLDDLLKISQSNGHLNRMKAMTRLNDKDYKQALSYANQAIQSGLSDPRLRLVAGYASYQMGSYEEAHKHLLLIASQLPDNHPGLRLLASTQLKLGLSLDAKDVLSRLDQPQQGDAQLFAETGMALARTGFRQQAETVVERTSVISQSAEDLARLGLLKLSIDDVSGLEQLEQAVLQAPNEVSAKYTLAVGYLQQGKLDEALSLAQDWQAIEPDSIRPYMLKGQIYILQKRFDEAKEQISHALELMPDSPAAGFALIKLALLEGNTDKALTDFPRFLQKHPQYTPALTSYYVLLKDNGRSKEGMQPTVSAHQAEPENSDVAILLARMYLNEGDYTQSSKTLEQLGDNQSERVWQVKASILVHSQQYSKAEHHFERWLEHSPYSTSAMNGQLLLMDQLNKFERGASLSQAYREVRDTDQLDLIYTHFLVMSGRFEEAQKIYEKLPESMVALPVAKGIYARLLLAAGKNEEALPYAQVAYADKPDNRNLTLLLNCFEVNKQMASGVKLLKDHMASNPDSLAASMLLAERQISASPTQAIETYEKALSLNKDNFIVLNNLAYLEHQNGDLVAAERYARQAVKLKPTSDPSIDTLAQILVSQGKVEQALEYYREIDNMDEQPEDIYLNYVEALFIGKQNLIAERKLSQREFKQTDSLARKDQLKAKYAF